MSQPIKWELCVRVSIVLMTLKTGAALKYGPIDEKKGSPNISDEIMDFLYFYLICISIFQYTYTYNTHGVHMNGTTGLNNPIWGFCVSNLSVDSIHEAYCLLVYLWIQTNSSNSESWTFCGTSQYVPQTNPYLFLVRWPARNQYMKHNVLKPTQCLTHSATYIYK